jgi:hypothetical protein
MARKDGSHPPNVQATVHTVPGQAEALLVTVLRAPIGYKDVVGADGVMHSVPDTSGGMQIEDLTLDISALKWSACYDLRNGRTLKVEDGKIVIPMQAGDGHPIVLLPYTVKSLTATRKIDDRALTVDWAISANTDKLTTHVVRVEVSDAKTGKTLRHFCANATSKPNGTGSVSFPLAAEDEARVFKVEVRDVLTGTRATAK